MAGLPEGHWGNNNPRRKERKGRRFAGYKLQVYKLQVENLESTCNLKPVNL
jgi:hypothetical protein